MKTKSTLFCLVFALFANTCITVNAQVNQQDSLALVNLYNSTDGPNWKRHDNWLTSSPLSKWWGITVTNARVTQIDLSSNNLEGNIPSSLGNLVNLEELVLSGNQLSGSIPSSLGNLINLQGLGLQHNQLSGGIPSSLGNLVNLQELRLDFNQLSGSIPSSIGNLTNLQDLWLSKNKLSGNVPSSIGNLINLQFAVLEYNELSGSIPSSIGNLIKLWGLFLNKNKLSGSIPSSIGNLINLIYLGASNNKLSGIPSSIGKLANLYSLDLSNNELRGSIPSSIGNLAHLGELYLSFNQLSGSIPSSIGNLSNFSYLFLDLSNNHLSGSIPSSFNKPPNRLHVNLSHNRFTFDGMELIAQTYPDAIYSPQANIPVHQHGNTLSVYAGGTLSNNTYEWFYLGKKLKKNSTKKEDSTIIQADSVFDPKKKGMYFVKVTNSVATQLTLQSDTIYFDKHQQAVIASSENALHQNDKTNSFRVYPNPAKNILYVQTNGNASFTLLDQSGKILLTTNISGKGSINVSGMAAGLYYLRNNSSGAVQKVIVSR